MVMTVWEEISSEAASRNLMAGMVWGATGTPGGGPPAVVGSRPVLGGGMKVLSAKNDS
jgi:hypothetical protein